MAQRAEGVGAQSRVRRSEGPESREQGAGGQVGRCPPCRPYAGEEEAREREPWTWQGAACSHGHEAGDVGSEKPKTKGRGRSRANSSQHIYWLFPWCFDM